MRLAAASASLDPRPPGLTVDVFESPDDPADADALAYLRAALAGADLAAAPVVLPDFHLKPDKEMPSSMAVATRETIRPTLTAPSVNCGMALVALDVERPTVAAITEFYRRFRERYPYPPTYRLDLTREEVFACATAGAHFAADRFGVDPAELEQMEERGRLDVDPFGGAARVRKELPWSVVQLSRIRFGTIGPSNHFVELQEVDEVLDPHAADLLGLRLGQTTLQFHGGGGSLPGELGLLFGRRKRYPRAVRLQMAVQKPLYHLGRARTLEQAKLRRSLYFSRRYPPIERHTPEGERLMLANLMAMNYGFAFRLATYSSLRALVRRCFGARGARLVVDSPHNTIYEEEIGGGTRLVHRHNASRIYPAAALPRHPVFGQIGQPLLVPGTNRTSSYLCVPGDSPDASLFSVCHGAGTAVKRLAGRGLSGSDPHGRTTLRFRYSGDAAVEVPQLDDRAVDGTIAALAAHGIVRPVVRLRPFAVLN